ncbi:hypothetical protein TVAGG3_0137080 [Trichomonas vaginalis G3]|uniref:hypothetical protein n=1 Tax=Trichomonas vaginalis (strain ATCC PRA-98 / G3) TaxID=412133 RepID=UPI0021E60348|nr:hypothetical protein TVAGG3_0137080 [Trichomonas vaginalis G3]KAI5546468.1 hypothetical protein TVAGG3_0137080 [Trichomonas vaginalis G3]
MTTGRIPTASNKMCFERPLRTMTFLYEKKVVSKLHSQYITIDQFKQAMSQFMSVNWFGEQKYLEEALLVWT